LAFRCQCLPSSLPEEQDKAVEDEEEVQDTDMLELRQGREPHEVCKECMSINKYGERLGTLDTASFVLARDPPSCLRENFVWFNEQRKFLLRERHKMLEAQKKKGCDRDEATRGQEDVDTKKKIMEAAADFESAREEVSKVKKWIQKFWEAVGAQQWAARMRKEEEEAATARELEANGGKDMEDEHGHDDSGLGDSVEGEEPGVSR
jgi:hypothetical protein